MRQLYVYLKYYLVLPPVDINNHIQVLFQIGDLISGKKSGLTTGMPILIRNEECMINSYFIVGAQACKLAGRKRGARA